MVGRDSKARNHSSKDGDSGHSKGNGREGNAGGGSEANGVPRVDAAALEHQVREDCARIAVEAIQPMDGNHSPRSEFVDNGCLAEGLWLSNPERGHGNKGRKVCRG